MAKGQPAQEGSQAALGKPIALVWDVRTTTVTCNADFLILTVLKSFAWKVHPECLHPMDTGPAIDSSTIQENS